MLESLKRQVEDLKRETFALYLATRDPRTPWHAKAFVAVVVAYAVSPIDLVPDFIPVLGVLDDLILIPAGAWVAYRLIPGEVLDDCRRRARESMAEGRPSGRAAAAVVIVIWLALAAACALWAWEAFAPRRP